jgi:hypothetical protein
MAIDTQNEFRFVQDIYLPDGNSGDAYDTVDEMAVVLGQFPFLSWPSTGVAVGTPSGHPDDASPVYYMSGG